jgi:glycosyltransferase involved in cell wall biosynthesis
VARESQTRDPLLEGARGMTRTASPTLGKHRRRRIVVSPTLRVRTVSRFDALEARGGGEIQKTATEEALCDLGVDARPWRPWTERLTPGDVLHLFGSRPEFVPLVDAAKQQGARIAVSTIAWFDWRNIWREPHSLAAKSINTIRYAARAACPALPSWRRRLYHAADILLPNSQAEAEQLVRLFRVPRSRIRVVPNGIDPRRTSVTRELFQKRFGAEDFVLCCGRIEPRKNQRALIQAVRGTGLDLVFIGNVVQGHEDYLRECRAEADDRVHFLGHLDHDDPLLASAYEAAACFALASWYETPGLAALEAAAAGTPLVVPSGGAAREYFGPWAEYVSPDDVPALRTAVLAAAGRGRNPNLAEFVRRNFTWRRAAETTLEAYGDPA